MTASHDAAASARGAAFAAVLALLAAAGCSERGPEPYGVVHDAGLSADEKSLLVLVEHGTKTTDSSSNLWRGDITTERPESMQVHEFDRRSGRPGRVASHAPPTEVGPRSVRRLEDYADKAAPAVAMKDCRELYTECAEATTPHPYRVGGRVLDPQAGKAIEWNGRQLVVAPFVAMSAAQIRTAREALFRRGVERMHAAAIQDFTARAATEDPERIATGDAGTAERDPGLTAFYRLLPGRITLARFAYGETRFGVVWQRDGACVTDSPTIAAPEVGCQRTEESGLDRAARGIAQARPPDPDRAGTTWGVIATTDRPETPQGTVTVACNGQPPRASAGKPCDDREGDTACRTSLPMLCSNADASLAPQSPRARRLALTAPLPGTELVSMAVADRVCRTALGDGWRMTEVEESRNKYQITGIGSLPATTRFWVRNGAGLANCW